EIARKTILSADLNVTSGAFRIINQHSANWCLVRIGHRQFLESVIVHQFLTGLFCQGCLWTGLHHACGVEGFFNVVPALRMSMSASAFLCNGRSPAQLWINV